MNEQQTSRPSGGERIMNERCLCREVLDQLRECFGVSPEVRKHLTNSRVEFLKAIREVINQRIEHLSKTSAEHGTKIAVE